MISVALQIGKRSFKLKYFTRFPELYCDFKYLRTNFSLSTKLRNLNSDMPRSGVFTLAEGQAEKTDKVVKVDPQYILSSNSPVVELDASAAFDKLNEQEKKYAHYLSRASWYGGLICFLQGSPEGASIFALVLKVFGGQPVKVLQRAALENGVSDDEFKALLVYASGILTHCANYKSFGDTKFIPAASERSFLTVIKQSAAYQRDPAGIDELWQRIRPLVFSLEDREKTLGFPDKGITTYLSANITKEDTDLINRYLQKCGMEAYNTRAFKTTTSAGKTCYEIRLASEETSDLPGLTRPSEEFEGATFQVTRGDFAPLMGLCANYLEKAQEFAANETEKSMLAKYAESFRTGSLDAHKDGSRFWIRDKGPVIETYIGFIETYRDPAGQRGEFCGWVAMVNRERSQNFAALVDSAEVLLSKLPWAGPLEKDRFLRPDFTSLDVLTFADSGIPAGINIPNYDCIRQNEGFKNVSLGNVLSCSLQEDSISFLSASDQALLRNYRVRSFEVQVGLHELLGHGSGKLFVKGADGKLNFNQDSVINPLTGRKIETWYEEGETYDSKFTTISSSYEECRAEAVGLYLSLLPEVLKIFGYEGEEAETLTYVNWLSLLWGVVAHGPESYSPENKKWLQSHTQARFVLLRVLLEAGEGLVKLEESAPGQNLLLTLDREKIHTVGKKAIHDFLLKLQVYKSTCDVSAASGMYAHYSVVPESGSPWVNWRKIALAFVKPRRMFVQANTQLTDEGVVLKRYEASFAGVISSWAERYSSDPDIFRLLDDLTKKDEFHFNKINLV